MSADIHSFAKAAAEKNKTPTQRVRDLVAELPTDVIDREEEARLEAERLAKISESNKRKMQNGKAQQRRGKFAIV